MDFEDLIRGRGVPAQLRSQAEHAPPLVVLVSEAHAHHRHTSTVCTDVLRMFHEILMICLSGEVSPHGSQGLLVVGDLNGFVFEDVSNVGE